MREADVDVEVKHRRCSNTPRWTRCNLLIVHPGGNRWDLYEVTLVGTVAEEKEEVTCLECLAE